MATRGASRHRVLLADDIAPTATARLGREFDLVRPDDGSDAALERAITTVEAVVVRTTPLPRATLERAGRLRVIAKHGVGVDAIDVEYASERGIVVANVPGANGPAVAEFTLTAILLMLKPLRAGAEWLRQGPTADANLVVAATAGGLIGREVAECTVGLLGWGGIGRRVGGALTALGARIVVHDPIVGAAEIRAAGVEVAGSLGELLPEAEVLSIHVPLTAATRGIIGAAELAAMPVGSALVNTARGGIVDEEALAAAIRAGRMSGAAIDVFEREPPSPDHPLLALPQVTCTPHIAGATDGSLRRMADGAADAVFAVLAGRAPASVVNPAVLSR
jgi:phosphoglycerate dehydrogenase-like enzyme